MRRDRRPRRYGSARMAAEQGNSPEEQVTLAKIDERLRHVENTLTGILWVGRGLLLVLTPLLIYAVGKLP